MLKDDSAMQLYTALAVRLLRLEKGATWSLQKYLR